MGWDEPVDKAPLTQEVAPHRGRKDTRRWCKGKVGRVHEPVIELDKGAESMRKARPSAGRCEYGRSWRRSTQSEQLVWTCSHVEVCRRCRKILTYSFEMKPELCPEWYDKGPGPDLCECGDPLHEHTRSWRGECTSCGCSHFRWVGKVAR